MRTHVTWAVALLAATLCPNLLFAASPSGARHNGATGYSETEINLQQRLDKFVNAREIHDPPALAYVNHLASRLVQGCGSGFPAPKATIIESRLLEAVALPGGSLYLSSALIISADNEAELAAIMAHQLAHICTHQFVRGTAEPEIQRLLNPPLLVVQGGGSFFGPILQGETSLPPLCKSFTPEFETEADAAALNLLSQAGYDPQAMLTSFQQLAQTEAAQPERLDRDFATHLLTSERAARLQAGIVQLGVRASYAVNTSDFDEAKHRLEQIQSAHVPSGSIQGRVMDVTGAPVAGATIRAENLGSREKYLARSDSSGQYRLANVYPGTYRVTIDSPGFKNERLSVEVQTDSSTPLMTRLLVEEGGHMEVMPDRPH